jgi:membrane protein
MSAWVKRIQSFYQQANQRSDGLLGIPVRAVERFTENRGPEAAASISYYAIFSIFPLLIMVVVALSYYLEQEVVQELLIDYIVQVLPVTPEVIIGQIETMLNARTAVSLVALIGFLWAASGVFNTLALNMDYAWQKVKHRNVFQRRLVAIGMVGGLVGLTFISMVVTTALDVISTMELGQFTVILATPLVRILSGYLPFLFRLLIIWMLYRWVPATHVRGSTAFLGALLTTLVWEMVTNLFSWYLSSGFSAYELIYGSLGAIIALLIWVYVSAQILLIGAYFTEAIEYRHISKVTGSKPWKIKSPQNT